MTSSIEDSQDLRLPQQQVAAARESQGTHWLINATRVFTATTALIGVGFITAALTHNEWRMSIIGMTFAIISCVGGAVLVNDTLLADRHAFYERGSLDGYMRCWRGELPSAKDPLVRR